MEQDNQREAIQLAYLAGIIDGEGTIGIVKSNKKNWNPQYSAGIGIGMSDKETVETLLKMFTPDRKLLIECVPNRKTIYRWRVIGNKAVPPILKIFLPYLRIKREQAEIVIKFCETRKSDRTKTGKTHFTTPEELQRREEFYQKIKKLNAVGALATTK